MATPHFRWFLFPLLISSKLSFGAYVYLSEDILVTHLKLGVPQWDQAALGKLEALSGSRLFGDQFAGGLSLGSEFSESDDPRQSAKSEQYSLAYGQRLPLGMSTSLGYIHRLEKFGPLLPGYANQESYVPVLFFNLNIDLWKNIFGSLDRAQQNHLEAIVKQSEISKTLGQHKVYTILRTLYWRIVIQKRRIDIYQNLVKSAELSHKTIKARYKDKIADLVSVTEIAAHLAAAKANYRKAQIDHNRLEKDLKMMIPSLKDHVIKAKDGYQGVQKVVNQAIECSKTVANLESVPENHTQYDELMAAIDEALQWKLKETDNHASTDIKLKLESRSFGLDPDEATAKEQPFALEKTAYTASLSLTIPIGSPYQTERLLAHTERFKADIRKESIHGELEAIHSNIKYNFEPLSEAIKLYHQSLKDQDKAFKLTVRKFNQGRISVFDYLNSQTNLLTSRLQVTELEERMLVEMLGYFGTFNQSPCKFNRRLP